MPEGDTLHRTAAGMRRVLLGERVRRFRASHPRVSSAGRSLEGRRIVAIDARGKHLLIRFDDGRALRTHLRMSGSWHLYRPEERWKKPASRARVVLETAEAVAVCFSAPDVEVLTGSAARRGGAAGDVGPDLLDPDVELEEAVRRWRARGELPIGEAVMRQQLVSGIGNVYKSEILFLCGLNPFRRVADLDGKHLLEVATTAQSEMRGNLGPGPRRTRREAGARYWVYRRSGKPCFRCRTPIEMRRQGAEARSTYYCPTCQRGRQDPVRRPAER